jgi:hypothetical protein
MQVDLIRLQFREELGAKKGEEEDEKEEDRWEKRDSRWEEEDS